MIHRVILRMITLVVCVMLLFGIMMPQANAQMDPTIRVYLKRLQIEDTLHVRIQGNYMIDDGSIAFADGAEMAIALRDGRLVLHINGVSIDMGETIRLLRCEGEKDAALYLQGLTGAYEGDLMLDVSENRIRPVLHIHVEDYLLGVVPFEMGDSFPLEALKAQAIAARTYALRKSGTEDRVYDVEDTTNDQAYKGRTTYSPLSEQAVRETEGLCGTYQGTLAQCYYSASNGGQTEIGQHVWPIENPDDYGYMDMRDDPYDLANDASSVKRYVLKKKPGKEGVGEALHAALVAALNEEMSSRGYNAEADLIRFDEIKSLTLQTPKFEPPSRLMTEMVFEVRVSVRECIYRDNEPRQEEAVDVSTELTPVPTATPAYSPYTSIKETIKVTLPIFTVAEKAMGLSINVYQNEMITVSDIGSSFMIESRRYGHGVGMSQRGAQQMAREHGMTWEQILTFYYPGLEVKCYSYDYDPLSTVAPKHIATPAPLPSPTPRPTFMPVSDTDLPKGAYLAIVSNIADDSSLNLRQSPSLSADIIRRLYKDQKLIVMSVNRDGWAHVKTDVIEGYVKSEFLQTVQE